MNRLHNNKKITINDIAEKAKVSKGTVSRVLSDSPLVKTETRERIKKIIKKNGYEPNYIARSLAIKRTYTLALILQDITNPFFSAIAKGVDDTARKYNFNVILCNTNYNKETEKQYISMVLRKRVDGIIITPVDVDLDNIKLIETGKLPFFILNSWSDRNEINYIVGDNYKGAQMAMNYLIEIGHRKIAYIKGPHIQGCEERLEGYKKTLKDNCINISNNLVIGTAYNSHDGYKLTKKLIETEKGITAIFAINDIVAIGAMKAIFDNNLRIPDDISLVGYDDIDISSMVRVPLTTINQQESMQGIIACEQIIKLIETNKSSESIRIVIKPKLIIRKSCRRIK